MDSQSMFRLQFEEMDGDLPCPTPRTLDDDIFSSDSADSCDSLHLPSTNSLTPSSTLHQHRLPHSRKSVRFNAVTVYYFSRRRSVTSVSSQGGRCLSMAPRHSAVRHYTLGELTCEQDSVRRQLLCRHLWQEKLSSYRRKPMRRNAQADHLTAGDVSGKDLTGEGADADVHFLLQPVSNMLSHEGCSCSPTGVTCQLGQTSFPCWHSCDGCTSSPLFAHTHCLQSSVKPDMKKTRQGLVVGRVCKEPGTSPAHCHATAHTAVGGELHSKLEPVGGAEEDVAVEEHEVQQDSLALENETAVLHLQSAEELERRREQEEDETSVINQGLCMVTQPLMDRQAEQGVGLVDIQEGFPPSASVLSFTETQDCASSLMDESANMVYYQIAVEEPSALVGPNLHAGECIDPEVVTTAVEGDGLGQLNIQRDFDENFMAVLPLLGSHTGSEDGPSLHPVSFQGQQSLLQENMIQSED